MLNDAVSNYAQCVIMLIGLLVSIIIPNVINGSVIMLTVVILNVIYVSVLC